MGEQAESTWAEKETSVVGGRWRKGAAETKCTPRKKIAQGSARGQCPVLFYGADGGLQEMEAGRRSMWAQQEGGRKDNS